jgi:hypothetical protein
MDPTENLRQQLQIARKIIFQYEEVDGDNVSSEDANTLATLVCALHDWMQKGGLPPAQWGED